MVLERHDGCLQAEGLGPSDELARGRCPEPRCFSVSPARVNRGDSKEGVVTFPDASWVAARTASLFASSVSQRP
jgi:hypothetical protein